MTLAITGASGPLGRLTAHLLIDLVEPHDVVLITRDPDAVADLANVVRPCARVTSSSRQA